MSVDAAKRAQEFRDWFEVYSSNVKDFRAFDLAGDVLEMAKRIAALEKCLRDVGYDQLARNPWAVPGP